MSPFGKIRYICFLFFLAYLTVLHVPECNFSCLSFGKPINISVESTIFLFLCKYSAGCNILSDLQNALSFSLIGGWINIFILFSVHISWKSLSAPTQSPWWTSSILLFFKNSISLQEVAKYVPENKILIETDSPYLAPTPLRGKINEPAYVHHTCDFISKLRNVEYDYFANLTAKNAESLFFRMHTPS